MLQDSSKLSDHKTSFKLVSASKGSFQVRENGNQPYSEDICFKSLNDLDLLFFSRQKQFFPDGKISPFPDNNS